MVWNMVRALIAAVMIVATAELSRRWPRWGALVLSLPIVSVLAFAFSWQQHRDLDSLAKMARETIVLVLLGMPFFVPLAFAPQLGLSFWPALLLGLVLASITVGTWLVWPG